MAVERKYADHRTPEGRKEILGVADRLAKECLAPRAAHYDATATHPVDSWRDVWREGMLAMGIPRRFGGLELDMPTYVRVIERLAAGCTNTGMTVHMHSTVTRFIDALSTEEKKPFTSGKSWRTESSLVAGEASQKREGERPCG